MTRGARAWVLVGGAAIVVAVAALIAVSDGGTPTTIAERARAVASGLRCPVCQNLSVADSPSALAGDMRTQIVARLSAGGSEDDVRDYFVARYGEWILLEPTRSGLNLVPWLFPIVAVVVGMAVWFAVVRRSPQPVAGPVSEGERRRIEGELSTLEDST